MASETTSNNIPEKNPSQDPATDLDQDLDKNLNRPDRSRETGQASGQGIPQPQMQPPKPPKPWRRWTYPGVKSPLSIGLAIVLTLTTIWSAYWFTTQSAITLLQGAKLQAPEAAALVPNDAPLMVSLLTQPERLHNLRMLRTGLRDRSEVQAEFDLIQQSLLADTDLTYARDIKPWLGEEVTLAVTALDRDRDPSNGAQPGYLVVLGVNDTERCNEFLNAYWLNKSLSGGSIQTEEYNGVKTIYAKKVNRHPSLTPQDFNPFDQSHAGEWASAIVGSRFVLFANDPEVLRQAINNVQVPELNLQNSAAYQTALATLTDRRVGLVVANLASLDQAFNPTLAPTSGQASEQTSEQTSQLPQTVAAALALDRHGLFADGLWAGATDAETLSIAPALTQAPQILDYIPRQAVAAVSGTDVRQRWAKLVGTLNEGGTLSQPIARTIQGLETQWGISLQENIFRWTTGEFALALLPGAVEQPSDWVFISQTTPEARAAIEQLDAIAAAQGYSPGVFTLRDHGRVFAWTKLKPTQSTTAGGPRLRLEAEVLGVHGEVGSYQVFASSLAAIDAVFSAPFDGSLRQQEGFAIGRSLLTEPSDGYFYVDWETGQAAIEREFPVLRVVRLFGGPLLNQLRTVSSSTYGREAGANRVQALLRFKA